MVRVVNSVGICILAAGMVALFVPVFGQAQSEDAKMPTSQMAAEHDGQHDFDFLFGNWKVHCRRFVTPTYGIGPVAGVRWG